MAALEAQPLQGTARVRVDLWGIELCAQVLDEETVEDLGAVVIIFWPRAAMRAEVLHATLSRLFGTAIPIAHMIERPILVPVTRRRLWQTGQQLNALRGWLLDEEDT